jgi:hypothetical protein
MLTPGTWNAAIRSAKETQAEAGSSATTTGLGRHEITFSILACASLVTGTWPVLNAVTHHRAVDTTSIRAAAIPSPPGAPSVSQPAAPSLPPTTASWHPAGPAPPPHPQPATPRSPFHPLPYRPAFFIANQDFHCLIFPPNVHNGCCSRAARFSPANCEPEFARSCSSPPRSTSLCS